MKRRKLFCIPHAGGLAGYYTKLSDFLNPVVDLCPVELAGRGIRADEEFYPTFRHAVEDVLDIITGKTGNEPYYLFGHSMGGLIVYELCIELKKKSLRLPEHVFFSAKYPPYVDEVNTLGDLSDEELLENMGRWGGTSSEFFKAQTLLEHFLPIVKADLSILKDYDLKNETIDSEITVMWGKNDKELSIMQGWKNMTRKKCDLIQFEGGHFYISSNLEGVAGVINNVITLKG